MKKKGSETPGDAPLREIRQKWKMAFKWIPQGCTVICLLSAILLWGTWILTSYALGRFPTGSVVELNPFMLSYPRGILLLSTISIAISIMANFCVSLVIPGIISDLESCEEKEAFSSFFWIFMGLLGFLSLHVFVFGIRILNFFNDFFYSFES